jgi:hypothetical protein
MLAFLQAFLLTALDGVEFVTFRPLYSQRNDFRYPADSKLHWLQLRGSIPDRCKRLISFSHRPNLLFFLPSLLLNLYLWVFFSGVKRPQRQGDVLYRSSTEVMQDYAWNNTSTEWFLSKHRDVMLSFIHP